MSDDDSTKSSLMRRLAQSAAFPAYVRQLPASTLLRLIEEVGLEDSHEILAAMDARQFRETMAIALWSASEPGQEEGIDSNQFVRWLELWLEEGDVMLSRRATELGEDLLVACLRLLVFAIDRTTFGVASQGVEIGNYVVCPKQKRHWPRTVEALVALWRYEPDFVLRVLRRCGYERTILNETLSEAEAGDSVQCDLIAQRAERRAHEGHVSGTDAALFLSETAGARLEHLCSLSEYDTTAARYLARAECSCSEGEHEPSRAQEPEFSALDTLLRSAGIFRARASSKRLSNPRTHEDGTVLEAAISGIAAASPQTASRLMRELAYLGNVLLAGTRSQGLRYTVEGAGRAAIAIANLGATFLLGEPAPHVSDDARLIEMLGRNPGLVRLFQIGFKLITEVPWHCCEALYRAKEVQRHRRGHLAYIEMERILGASRLIDLVSDGRFAEAKLIIDELSAVIDNAACVALNILIDPIPAYPLVLAGGGGEPKLYVDRGHRPIATISDLERIGVFIGSLDDYCGN